MNSHIINLFLEYDIIVLCESHFNVRITCPEGFVFSGRSKPVESKRPRGGVVVYTNKQLDAELVILTDDLRDALIISIKDSNIIIAALYIPPINSQFYHDIYFDNLNLIMDRFQNSDIIITGDLNARVDNMHDIYENIS